jgi:hypothetical protein
MRKITCRYHVIESGNRLIAVTTGEPAFEVGDEVSIESTSPRRTFEGRYIDIVHSGKAHELERSILHLIRARSLGGLLDALANAYGTKFPETVPLTVYELTESPPPVSSAPEDVEEVVQRPKRRRRKTSTLG